MQYKCMYTIKHKSTHGQYKMYVGCAVILNLIPNQTRVNIISIVTSVSCSPIKDGIQINNKYQVIQLNYKLLHSS